MKEADITAVANAPRLYPIQVCYTVDDVQTAIQFCEQQFAWGPFARFTAPNDAATYGNWAGTTVTEVGLGMAGAVQIELIHVHEGINSAGDFYSSYGAGLQHIGIYCKDRGSAQRYLTGLGAACRESGNVPGVNYGFVDAPACAWGMLELLEIAGGLPDFAQGNYKTLSNQDAQSAIAIDRVTWVVNNIASATEFLAAAFEWPAKNGKAVGDDIVDDHLMIDKQEYAFKRLLKKAGNLEIEVLEPLDCDPIYSAWLNDRYAKHSAPHGFIHIGGKQPQRREAIHLATMNNSTSANAMQAQWRNSDYRFTLINGPDGHASVQLRD